MFFFNYVIINQSIMKHGVGPRYGNHGFTFRQFSGLVIFSSVVHALIFVRSTR